MPRVGKMMDRKRQLRQMHEQKGGPKHPSPTGAIVSGTDPCTCGHAPEEHGREPAYPGSTACRECEDCVAYEADPEEP